MSKSQNKSQINATEFLNELLNSSDESKILVFNFSNFLERVYLFNVPKKSYVLMSFKKKIIRRILGSIIENNQNKTPYRYKPKFRKRIIAHEVSTYAMTSSLLDNEMLA